MKKVSIKRIASLILSVCLMLTFFSIPVFAQSTQASEYKLENQQDAIKLIDAANNGDQKAIQKLLSLKAFNKDEVNKVLNGVKFTAADKIKTFNFDDGSSITIELGNQSSIKEGTRELQNTLTNYFMYRWYVYGIECGRYLLWMRYQADSANCWGGYSWNTSSAVPPYGVTQDGTSNQVTQGLYVQSTGSGGLTAYGYRISSVSIVGYCYPNPLNDWCQIYVS
ncbi:MAG: hypothetical protein HPY74_18325 [Firmicutes bacterium]|nr:hypothetical protein [Bacillota bacterium]